MPVCALICHFVEHAVELLTVRLAILCFAQVDWYACMPGDRYACMHPSQLVQSRVRTSWCIGVARPHLVHTASVVYVPRCTVQTVIEWDGR